MFRVGCAIAIMYFRCFVLFVFFGVCSSQDCLFPAEKCSDTKECCGGCCISGVCTSTYDNCLLVDYPCQDEYCPPGFECYMYKPSDFCEGCGLQRACRPFTMPTTEVPQLN